PWPVATDRDVDPAAVVRDLDHDPSTGEPRGRVADLLLGVAQRRHAGRGARRVDGPQLRDGRRARDEQRRDHEDDGGERERELGGHRSAVARATARRATPGASLTPRATARRIARISGATARRAARAWRLVPRATARRAARVARLVAVAPGAAWCTVTRGPGRRVTVPHGGRLRARARHGRSR